jgi:RND family efflux transporter MFP subunit
MIRRTAERAVFVFLWAGLLAACSKPTGGTVGDAPTAERKPSAPIAVTVVKPEPARVWRTLTLSANIQPYEQAPLYAKVAGYVATIAVDIGDRVRKNEVLARLDIPEMEKQLARARSEVGERRAELAKAETEAKLAAVIQERSRALRRKKAITEQDLDEAEARTAARAADLDLARARVKSAESSLAALQALAGYAEIRAPYDGIIVKRSVDPGALVPRATSGGNASPIVMIGRADRLRVVVDVPEPDAPAIREGEQAILETRALAGKKFEGQVSRFARAPHPTDPARWKRVIRAG